MRSFLFFVVLLLSFTCGHWPMSLPAQGPGDKKPFDVEPVVSLFELILEADAETAGKCLAVLTEKVQTGELSVEQVKALRPRLSGALKKILAGKTDGPLYFEATLLTASWRDPTALQTARKWFATEKETEPRRLRILAALLAAGDKKTLPLVAGVLAEEKVNSASLRGAVLGALGRIDDPQVADMVLAVYPRLEEELQPKAIELLTQRTAWSKMLLQAIGRKQLPATVLGANQVRKLLASRDEELKKLVTAKWGSIRTERDPKRQQVILQMSKLLRETPGNIAQGQAVFNKVCGQCHKIHGRGQNVGPDLTANGRSTLAQLLSSVFDPSLVIGASYQARVVATVDGRVLTGLLVEDSPQRVVLKAQGGKLETIARDDVEEIQVSKLSLMPEGLEKQLKPQEIADLFSFLLSTKPPGDKRPAGTK